SRLSADVAARSRPPPSLGAREHLARLALAPDLREHLGRPREQLEHLEAVLPRRLQELLGDLRYRYALALPQGRQLPDILQPLAQRFADPQRKGLGLLQCFRHVRAVPTRHPFWGGVSPLSRRGMSKEGRSTVVLPFTAGLENRAFYQKERFFDLDVNVPVTLPRIT